MQTSSSGPLAGGSMSYLFIMVWDFATMAGFYRDVLGLEVVAFEEGRFAFFQTDLGGPQLALYPGRSRNAAAANHWFFAFNVPDIESTVATLLERGVRVGPIESVPFGRAAQFLDPEGNAIEMHQPDA